MSERRGRNWRNTLTDYASVSGVLAGFCVAFIGIVLGWSVADTNILGVVTYGNISVLLFGISVCLFIAARARSIQQKNGIRLETRVIGIVKTTKPMVEFATT